MRLRLVGAAERLGVGSHTRLEGLLAHATSVARRGFALACPRARLTGATIVCPTCSAENEDGPQVLRRMRHALARACPSCGTANAPTMKFCGECGSALGRGGPAPPSSAPDAERRLVSVLFADLVGFTTASEPRDAEDTRELLTSYFDTARTIVARHGGTVEKFIGDAVMAVWGAPIAHEDDAERAVRAALELVARPVCRRARTRSRLARACSPGEAAVTVGAVGQGMVAGDLVNTASRLQSIATPGTVLVGDATHRAASRSISSRTPGSAS